MATSLLCSIVSGLCTPVHAQGFDDGWTPPPDPAREGDSFDGTITDISARVGVHTVPETDLRATAIDAGLRTSFPMYIGDIRLAYRFDDIASADASAFTMHSIGVSLGVHPLYLLLLGSDWLSYVAASTYIDVGAGVQLGARTPQDDGTREVDPGLFWHWGGGVDVPLWNPDVGHALWLNLLYRNHRADFDSEAAGSISLVGHTFFAGLSYRFNRFLF